MECRKCHERAYFKKTGRCPFCGNKGFDIVYREVRLSTKQKEREESINRLRDNIIKPRRE